MRLFTPKYNILAYVSIVMSKLSINNMENVLDKISKANNGKEFESTIVNPIFGFLFESIGGIDNIRFYSPELIVKYFNNEREYTKDDSEDPLTKILIKLFPSPEGILSHISNEENNFGNYIMSKKTKGIEFLAHLFVKLLEEDNKTKISYNKKDNFLNEIENLFLSKTVNPMFEDNYIKPMIIHSFVINIFNTEDELELYLRFILKKIKTETVEKETKIPNILEKVRYTYNKINLFPYSPINKPPSNVRIPIYDRETDSFIEDATFPDCADVLLLNICNCLFYNTETGVFSTEHLKRKNSPNNLLLGDFKDDSRLAEFYRKNNKIFKIDMNMRREWSRVVQGLDDFNSGYKNDYGTDLIVYKREKRNEIKAGTINMMNSLIRICEINHAEFWKNFDGKNLPNKIKELLEAITLHKDKVSIMTESFYEFSTMNRTEFTGHFNILVNLSDLTVRLRVKHIPTHSEMEYVIDDKDKQLEATFSSENRDLKLKKLPEVAFETYLMMGNGKKLKLDLKNIFKTIFISGAIKNNSNKLEILNSMFEILVDIEKRDNSRIEDQDKATGMLKNIITFILKSVALSDEGTRIGFKPFLVYNSELLKDDMEAIDCWISSFTIKSDINKLWTRKIVNLKLKKLDVDFKKIPEDNVHSFFESLEEHPILESLRVRNVYFSRNMINSVKIFAEKANLLTELDISNGVLLPETSRPILEALQSITSLKSLNLSGIYFDNKFSKLLLNTIGKLQNLRSLDISYLNSNIFEGIEPMLLSTLKDLKYLEYLNVSGNNFNELFIEQILKINENLKVENKE